MTTAPATSTSEHEESPSRLRSAASGALSTVIRGGSQLLRIRHNPASWTAFRLILGFAGAALVVLPLSSWNSWLAAIAGLAMFLAAILLPPVPSPATAEEKTYELGAHIVNGGQYLLRGAPPARVMLFVGAEQISALDARLQQLLVIPAAEISSASVQRTMGRWLLQVRWSDQMAEFSYQGLSAERHARNAQSALAAVISQPRPAPRRARAANA